MDFNASLRRAIKTGDVILGQNNTEKCIKEGKAQMIVIAANCPENFKNQLTGYENIFIHTFEGSSVALGKAFACGVGAGIGVVLIILFYVLVALFLLGAVAGWFAVRHIRHLEPGILGRQRVADARVAGDGNAGATNGPRRLPGSGELARRSAGSRRGRCRSGRGRPTR